VEDSTNCLPIRDFVYDVDAPALKRPKARPPYDELFGTRRTVSESVAMPSVEQLVKEQYAKLFDVDDWPLFKETAEAFLREAAHIKTTDMQFWPTQKLLARNSRKRLLIGIGVELLLKSVYLKNGYSINKRQEDKSARGFPFTQEHAATIAMDDADSYSFEPLVANITGILKFEDQETTLKGLKIAKVFRNKEGHVVTGAHQFDPTNYRDIEASLVILYERAFQERLFVHFSLEPDEPAEWYVSPLART